MTGAWIDEAHQLMLLAKQVIKGRLGRYPKTNETPVGFTPRYFLETSNPMPANHPMYTAYDWRGPKILQEGAPLLRCTDKECGNTFSCAIYCPTCGALGEEMPGKRDWRTAVYDCDQRRRSCQWRTNTRYLSDCRPYRFLARDRERTKKNLRPHYWDAVRHDYEETPRDGCYHG